MNVSVYLKEKLYSIYLRHLVKHFAPSTHDADRRRTSRFHASLPRALSLSLSTSRSAARECVNVHAFCRVVAAACVRPCASLLCVCGACGPASHMARPSVRYVMIEAMHGLPLSVRSCIFHCTSKRRQSTAGSSLTMRTEYIVVCVLWPFYCPN